VCSSRFSRRSSDWDDRPLNASCISVAGLRTIIVEPTGGAVAVVAMLHGHAMRPEDLSPFAAALDLPVRFLFPEAPLDAVPEGRAWWHIDMHARARAMARGPRDLADQKPPGMDRAREHLSVFLAEAGERWGGAPVALVGFSQGGMLACDTVLHGLVPVSALALLSASRIAFREWLPRAHRVRGLPVLVSHGVHDPDLAFSAGEALRDFLSATGAVVTWVPFPEGHEIPLSVWRALKRFLHSNVVAAASRS
jgi:phospholipase/carboxylesterase